MGSGPPISPYVFENRDADGNINARFDVSFTGTNQTLTGIVAYNVQGSGLTQIQVTRATDQTTSAFPLPTSGKKVAVNVTDPQGNPTTISCYTANVSQNQINAQGYVIFSDIGSYTVY